MKQIATDEQIKQVLVNNEDFEGEETYSEFVPVVGHEIYSDEQKDELIDRCVKIARQMGR